MISVYIAYVRSPLRSTDMNGEDGAASNISDASVARVWMGSWNWKIRTTFMPISFRRDFIILLAICDPFYRFAYESRSRCWPFSRSRSATTCHFLFSLASPIFKDHDIYFRVTRQSEIFSSERNLRVTACWFDVRLRLRRVFLKEGGVRVITRS